MFLRMWTWGKRWTRAPGSSVPTATTLTWPSSMTTWTRLLRHYRLLWTNCATSPSGSRSTGSTDNSAVSHHRPKTTGPEQRHRHFCSSLLRLLGLHQMFFFTQREIVLIYFTTFYENFLLSTLNVEFNWKSRNGSDLGYIFAFIYCVWVPV